jgi:hypothetical protein
MTSRVIFVYGTQGTSGMPEVTERRKLAKMAADFSVSFGNYEQPSFINPRVIADREVTADDYLSSNLVLFGTKETNSVIAKLGDKLPFQLNGEASGYGLVYGYPVNGKMVVVVSGIPFWTTRPPGQGQASAPTGDRNRMRIRFASGTGMKAAMGLQDFLLFKETNDQVISEGYFDNDWKLPAEELSKLKGSGVVEVRP